MSTSQLKSKKSLHCTAGVSVCLQCDSVSLVWLRSLSTPSQAPITHTGEEKGHKKLFTENLTSHSSTLDLRRIYLKIALWMTSYIKLHKGLSEYVHTVCAKYLNFKYGLIVDFMESLQPEFLHC